MLTAQQQLFWEHLSFDYIQSVPVPNFLKQPGRVYFLSPRKVRGFGVSVDSKMVQYNYMLQEGTGDRAGKGADSVCSMLHDVIGKQVGDQVQHLTMHADNCGGQNKNRIVSSYLAYLVAVGRFESCELSFMVAGHTKFHVDQNFGQIKRKFYSQDVLSMNDLQKVVNESCKASTNKCVLDTELEFYNWEEYLMQFFDLGRLISNIRQLHNLKFYM